jgi:short-subunit dehydrogenase
LTDRVLLITGASSGIGAAVAVEAAKAGMHITLSGRRADRLMQVAKRVADVGRKAHFFTCNVANHEDIVKLFEQHWQRFGRLDAVLANAGYGIVREAHATPLADHRALFETNYWGTVSTLRESLKYIERTAGGLNHLLVTSSCLSELGPPCYGPYAATKAAQDCFAQAMRAELHGRGYDVTTIHPVGTRTEFFDAAEKRSAKFGKGLAMNSPDRFVQSAEHVARKVVKALQSPRAEVWPNVWARYGLALATALPGLTSWQLRRMYVRHGKDRPAVQAG